MAVPAPTAGVVRLPNWSKTKVPPALGVTVIAADEPSPLERLWMVAGQVAVILHDGLMHKAGFTLPMFFGERGR